MKLVVLASHILAFAMGWACLFTTRVFLVNRILSETRVELLARLDALYGIIQVFVLVTGLVILFFVTSSAESLSQNHVFHFKVGLFLFSAVLSIYPTMMYYKFRTVTLVDWYKNRPKSLLWTKRLVTLQMFCWLALPFLAFGVQ
jgi:putative membrane protein